MAKFKQLGKLFVLSAIFISFGFMILPYKAQALTIFGVDLQCSPEKAPNKGGCGIPAFTLLIGAIIDFLTKTIVVPLAVIMMIYAGFVIMTAGGSADKVSQGRKIITTALIGVVIALLAGVAVGIIYKLVTNQAVPLP